MECDKCRNKNLELLSSSKGLSIDAYSFDENEYEVLKFKCFDCGHEFTECV